MTYVWGDALSSASGNAAKAGLELVVSSDGTTATVTARAGFWSRWSCSDGVNTWSLTGDLAKSGTNQSFITSVDSSWSTSNQILGWTTATASFPLATHAGTTKTATLTIGAIGVAGDQPISVSASIVLPPSAPSGGSATAAALVGGRWSTTLAWTNAGGYSSLAVSRTENGSPASGIYAGAVVSSLTVDTLTLDRRYTFAVQGANSGGTSAPLWIGPVVTPPAAPTSLTAARSGTSIVGAFVNQSSLNPSFALEDSTDGGATWTPVLTVAANNYAVGQSVAYTWVSPNPAVSHLLRVRAVASTLGSSWTQAATAVSLISRPNAPTGLTSGVADAATAITLAALPASTVLPDGSAVTAYNWRHRAKGASTWTETGKTTATTLAKTLPAGTYSNGGSLEHQVQVWGAHADASDWSAVATVLLSATPISTITSPTSGSTIAGDTLTITATGFDPDSDPITAIRWGLEDATGNTLALATTAGTVTSHTYPAKLADGATATAWVQHQESHGLWSARTQATYPVAYVGPADLTVTTAWDVEDAALGFTWAPTTVAGKPTATSVDVYLLVDGVRTMVAEGLSPSGAWRYRRAPLVDATYMLAVRSALPSTTWQTVAVDADPDVKCLVVVNGGPAFWWVASGVWNITLDTTAGRDRSLSDGWANSPYARESITELLSDSRQVDCVVDDAGAAFVAVQSGATDLWYRDPTGASWACSMTKPRVAVSYDGDTTVAFTVSRVGGGPTMDDVAAETTADTIYADLVTAPIISYAAETTADTIYVDLIR